LGGVRHIVLYLIKPYRCITAVLPHHYRNLIKSVATLFLLLATFLNLPLRYRNLTDTIPQPLKILIMSQKNVGFVGFFNFFYLF
jgi:hypothetical protein